MERKHSGLGCGKFRKKVMSQNDLIALAYDYSIVMVRLEGVSLPI